MMNAVGDIKRASFEGILLAFIRPVLAKDWAQTLIEALGRGRWYIALLDPAKHVVLGVSVGASALGSVEVGVAPGHKLKVDGIEDAFSGERGVQDPADKVLALGSAGLAVEGQSRRGAEWCGEEEQRGRKGRDHFEREAPDQQRGHTHNVKNEREKRSRVWHCTIMYPGRVLVGAPTGTW